MRNSENKLGLSKMKIYKLENLRMINGGLGKEPKSDHPTCPISNVGN